MKKTAKNKVISKKQSLIKPVVKSLVKVMSKESLKATGNKKNPYMARSSDGKNIAFGKTRTEALSNLVKGIKERE